MSYTALYRKFRPQTFEEVRGQEHVVTTLKNQITTGRIGHAYLFTGTRGTGKTSIAKIFARAVNCENHENASPCNECDVCKSILKGRSMNVIEIDAASNNGVDNIRQIIEEVSYAPTEGKYKVYIIDEVHMLSAGAFNALLKTLEEPPEYVIFILATTEVHKIPITILSRCQRYDFRRISVDTIEDQLKNLIEKEGVSATDKAIRYIAKLSDGAMRDALSLLDQCIAFYLGQELTYELVLEVLGTVDIKIFSDFFKSIIESNIKKSLKIIDEAVISGRDLGQFITDFTWYLRNIMLIKQSSDDSEVEEFIDASKERIEDMRQDGGLVDDNTILRFINILSELSNQIKFSTVKRVLVEIAIIKMSKPQMQEDLTSVIQRITDLEKKIENGVVVNSINNYNNKAQEEQTHEYTNEINEKPLQRAIPKDVQYVVDNWHKIEESLGIQARKAYDNAKFSVEGDNILLAVFSDPMYMKMVQKEEEVNALNDIIREKTGKDIKIVNKLVLDSNEFKDRYTEIKKKININIEQEDY